MNTVTPLHEHRYICTWTPLHLYMNTVTSLHEHRYTSTWTPLHLYMNTVTSVHEHRYCPFPVHIIICQIKLLLLRERKWCKSWSHIQKWEHWLLKVWSFINMYDFLLLMTAAGTVAVLWQWWSIRDILWHNIWDIFKQSRFFI
jgi:hypothetical protein